MKIIDTQKGGITYSLACEIQNISSHFLNKKKILKTCVSGKWIWCYRTV